jgi:oleandomycin transport system ATP-binding protein
MDHPAIVTERLVKSLRRARVLDGVDLRVPEGTVFGLLGPNGAGKTTMVRVLTTLLRPDSGRALVLGHDVVTQPQQVRRLIGLTGQYAAVDDLLSARENLYMIGRLLGQRRRAARRQAADLLTAFGLADAAATTVKSYSGGMRRRLDLAASLVGEPRVLFLDEPTTGLDPASRAQMWGLIRDRAAAGATVLLTTQYLDEADQLAGWIAVIDHGRLIAEGTPDDLKARTGGQVIEIRPAQPGQRGDVARVLAEITGAEITGAEITGTEITGAGGDLISAPVSDPGLLGAVVKRLAEERVAVSHLALRLPSLDEAFLMLTRDTERAAR